MIDEGLIEKFVRAIQPFMVLEANAVDRRFRREKTWLYPLEAVRETLLNALVHRDWTRAVDIEITRYADRLEVLSPGALPNTMTIDKMKAGRRTPRNPIILEVMRDYGYVDARGMGVRTKVIPLTRRFTGTDPLFEADEDCLKTTIRVGSVPDDVPEKRTPPRKNRPESGGVSEDVPVHVPGHVPETSNQGQLLSLIRINPQITYDELAKRTGVNRKTVQRRIQTLKKQGLLRRQGSARDGHWEVDENGTREH